MERRKPFCRKIAICALILVLGTVAQAQYGGGTGEPNDPYLITTPEQMNAIGADPNDWDKHFKLMADLDLAQYTGTEFNLIGSARSTSRTRSVDCLASFVGVFDGNGHVISNFTYSCEGEGGVGLFRCVGDPNAQIKGLGLVSPNVDAEAGDRVGSLVGYMGYGIVTNCYVSGGIVAGGRSVGGLIGYGVGDWNRDAGCITGCYATAAVIGDFWVGGLVGSAYGAVANCYAMGIVLGGEEVGGLVGQNGAEITNCYASGVVLGDWAVGGLAGGTDPREAVASFWDVQTSRQQTSAGGEGRTMAQMQALVTFRAWGEGDNAGVWTIDEGNDYPRLAWEHRPGIVIEALEFTDLLRGMGTVDDPHLIYTADELELIAGEPNEWSKHFKLMADIDLGAYPGVGFNAGWGDRSDNSYPFSGVFDGNGHVISNFTYLPQKGVFPGFFGYVQRVSCQRRRGSEPQPDCDPNAASGIVKNLGLLDPIVDGRQVGSSGALVEFLSDGTVSNCYVEGGLVLGEYGAIGGLVGYSYGTITQCHAVGGTVIGGSETGGLVGYNGGDIIDCYSANTVTGEENVGGLIGWSDRGDAIASFWNIEASGQETSTGGIGLTTNQMQTAATFMEAGWDFVGEVENGTEDVWWIDEGVDYPRLWWERADGEF